MKPQPTPPQPRTTYWIDVQDHLPDDETRVLVAFDDGEVDVAYRDADRWLGAMDSVLETAVTHWADLPEPPNR